MTSINTRNTTTAATTSASSLATAAGGKAMGKEDFLKLLVAQLSHQDPLKPQEGAEFVAELAQFSNLEQLMGANDKLSQLSDLSQLQQGSQAMALVGKTVGYDTSTLDVDGLSASPLRFSLARATTETKAEIVDANGKVVRTIDLGALPQGAQKRTFDGLGDDLAKLPAGSYKLRVKGLDANGGTLVADTLMTGKVDAVVYENGRTQLEIAGAKVALSDVSKIQQ
jgi:flagellar basal-body rod modification protein FlgD